MVFDCLNAKCSTCCKDTLMPLTLEDIKRLTGKGYKVREFVVTCGGERKLRNLNGYCFFLDEGVRSVYDERPTGCRLYPLVADWRGMVRIDPMCRHGDKFTIDEEDVYQLRHLLKKLRAEKRREIPVKF